MGHPSKWLMVCLHVSRQVMLRLDVQSPYHVPTSLTDLQIAAPLVLSLFPFCAWDGLAVLLLHHQLQISNPLVTTVHAPQVLHTWLLS